MRIAIVGSGISGLVAAYLLAERHRVVLFEADGRVGGHTHTVDVVEGERPLAVDTGFIVFNTRTYPNFVRLLRRLGVPWQQSDMSFSVRSDRRDLEYAGSSLDGLFAQRRNLLRPRHYRMLRDIVRFYREARELLEPGAELPLVDYLRARGYSEAFVVDHLLPMVGAVWSTNRADAGRFPARFVVRFFDHHGFLQVEDRPAWLTVAGGSRHYVRAICAELRGEIRLRCPVDAVRRVEGGVLLKARGQEPERFDHAVLACHADQALRMLEDPSGVESEALGAFPYQANDVVLHRDPAPMPRRRRAWASWNYHLDDEVAEGASVTYWMNRLQRLDAADEYFVTLNRPGAARPERVLGRYAYAHPMFRPASVPVQARHEELIDHRATSYCGAYWRNGFHEDGVVSALAVCRRFGVTL